jgi:DNA-binding beta-propeller fold protein YncE
MTAKSWPHLVALALALAGASGSLFGQTVTRVRVLPLPGNLETNLAVDDDANAVLVSNEDPAGIERFALDGTFQIRIESILERYSGLAIRHATGQLFTCLESGSEGRIVRSDLFGNVQLRFGLPGDAPEETDRPSAIAVNQSNGEVYVGDAGSNRIIRFTADGGFIGLWGSPGTGNGQFDSPNAVAVDSTTGRVFVADVNHHRIQRFSASGEFERAWGEEGTGDGQFERISAVALDAAGRLYVADFQTSRVQRFSADGAFQIAFDIQDGAGRPSTLIDLAIGSSGLLYVLDSSRISVWRVEEPLDPTSEAPTIRASGKTRFRTSRKHIVLRGAATSAEAVKFKAGKGRFRPAKGSAAHWKIPLRLKPGRTVVKVRATGPGGTSEVLRFLVTRRK